GLTTKTPVFTQLDNAQLAEIKAIANSFNCDLVPRSKNATNIDYNIVGRERRIYKHKSGTSSSNRYNPITHILIKHGLMGKKSPTKFIPEAIWTAPKKVFS